MRVTEQERRSLEFDKAKEYNKDTIDLSKCHYHDVEDDYDYLKNNLFYKFLAWIVKGILRIYIPLHDLIMYHLKVEGRNNLKKVKGKGVIGICNHTQYMDVAISRFAFYHKKYYATSAIFNNKNGFGGKMMKALGSLPLSPKPSAQKKLCETIKKVTQSNTAVMFYPEKAMWKNYRKPRPFMKGAFYYAVKANVPIVPMIVLYRDSKKIDKITKRKNRLTLKIMEPIYPNMGLDEKMRIEYMRDKAQFMFNQAYENFYGKPNDVIAVPNPDGNMAKYLQ